MKLIAKTSFQIGRQSAYSFVILVILVAAFTSGCDKIPDHPHLAPGVIWKDIKFESKALGRPMTYRIYLPDKGSACAQLKSLYLLHGGGGGYRDWSNYADVAPYVGSCLAIVMPEGESSYYVNSYARSNDRFEDYVVDDLISNVESRFPVKKDRRSRAIAGVSMGGFGAVTLGLKYPDLFIAVAGISPAVHAPTLPFSIRRIAQWKRFRSIFGPPNGPHQQQNDPFVLVQTIEPAHAPVFFLSCGQQEGLLPGVKRLSSLLTARRIRCTFNPVPGGHTWTEWAKQVPDLMRFIEASFAKS